jgi:hypothetical protein
MRAVRPSRERLFPSWYHLSTKWACCQAVSLGCTGV